MRIVRSSRRICVLAVAAVVLVVAAGCTPMITNQVASDRAAAGRAPVVSSTTLNDSATAHAQQNCATGAATPSEDPYAEFDAETAKAAGDLAGLRATRPLDRGHDPTASSPRPSRSSTAGSGSPVITDPRWNNIGVGPRSARTESSTTPPCSPRTRPCLRQAGTRSSRNSTRYRERFSAVPSVG